MGGRGETGEVMQRWENMPTTVHSQSLNPEPNTVRSHYSSAVSKYTKPTGKHRSSWPAQKTTANYTFSLSSRGLWDASGTATDTCRGHRDATSTGADGDGWRVVWFVFPFLWNKIACNHVIKDYHK